MMTRLLAGGLVLLVFAATSQAEIWKWTDPETGKVTYGEHPPAGGTSKAERVEAKQDSVRRPPAGGDATDDSNERMKRKLEDLRRQRLQRDESKRQQLAKEEARQQLRRACKQAASNLEALTIRGQASIAEGDGYRTLTEQERQGHIADTKEFLSQHCRS